MKPIQLTTLSVANSSKFSVILEMKHMGRQASPPLYIHALHALCKEWMSFVYVDIKSQLCIIILKQVGC